MALAKAQLATQTPDCELPADSIRRQRRLPDEPQAPPMIAGDATDAGAANGEDTSAPARRSAEADDPADDATQTKPAAPTTTSQRQIGCAYEAQLSEDSEQRRGRIAAGRQHGGDAVAAVATGLDCRR